MSMINMFDNAMEADRISRLLRNNGASPSQVASYGMEGYKPNVETINGNSMQGYRPNVASPVGGSGEGYVFDGEVPEELNAPTPTDDVNAAPATDGQQADAGNGEQTLYAAIGELKSLDDGSLQSAEKMVDMFNSVMAKYFGNESNFAKFWMGNTGLQREFMPSATMGQQLGGM